MDKFPDSYIIGQEYVNDKRIEITMKFYAGISCVFPTCYAMNNAIKIYFNGVDCVIEYNVELSQKLIKDIEIGSAEAYVWSYFNAILPYINSVIYRNRYEKGQILCKAISMYDINAVEIIENSQIIKTFGANVFSNFKDSFGFEKEKQHVYIRDFMDALTAKLYCNYEECIRKIITSLENYFIREGMEIRTFKSTLKYAMRRMKFKYGKNIIYKNLCYIYDLRNEIVHDKLRVEHHKKEWETVCHLGLGSLRYYFMNSSTRTDENRYIDSVGIQYLLINKVFDDSLCKIIENERIYREENSVKIETEEDFQKNMYDQMIINDRIKNAIKGNDA